MATLILFNKPFNTLSQFTDDNGRATLANFIATPGVYPAGRLDYDSEGLLLLTDSGPLQAELSHPRHAKHKLYWAQVEGLASAEQCRQLCAGVELRDGPARAVACELIDEPPLWPRQPPIRERRQIPTSWIAITLDEGRNRQVRRMTAAVGLPTLRLVRAAIGDYQLNSLQPGQSRTLEVEAPESNRNPPPRRTGKGNHRPSGQPSNRRPGRR